MTVEAESHFTSVFFLNNVFHGLLINRLRVTTSEAVVHVFFSRMWENNCHALL